MKALLEEFRAERLFPSLTAGVVAGIVEVGPEGYRQHSQQKRDRFNRRSCAS
jgi:hypothetical protein